MNCDLDLSEDQRQILDAAAGMLETCYPVSRRAGSAQDDLADLAAFGAFGLALPEGQGGSGFSVVEEALVHVLLGRHLVSSRALATSVGVRLAAMAGRDDLVRDAIAGDLHICAGIPSGETALLVDRGDASHAVVFGARSLALVEVGDAARETVVGLGHGAPLERVALDAAPVLARSDDDRLLGLSDLLVCAQLLGVSEAARDLAISYAQIRQQFGQPIGGFQAIKHHCANMAIGCEMISSLLDIAAIALRGGSDDAPFQLAALRRLAPEVALRNARLSIQMHGGIGFSAEADIHHYLKQAHLLARLGGAAEMFGLAAPLSPHMPPAEERK